MTLRTELARHEAAVRYQHAAITADIDYRDRARADLEARQAADVAATDAAFKASLPTIVDDVQRPAAGVALGTVTVERPAPTADPAAVAPAARQALDVIAGGPLEPAKVDAVLARYRGTGLGAAALEQFPDPAGNLPFALPALAMIANGIRDADRRYRWIGRFSEADEADQLALLEALVGVGRHLAGTPGDAATVPTAPSATRPTRGQRPMPEQMTRDAALKEFNQETARFHDARARNDWAAAKAHDARRQLLAPAIWPGEGPPADARQIVS